ncbi:MAG: septum formation initiator family protein [Gammaproteobacteria bacterium]|nr:septum formation initiator family protein [Gammaproteobacteria bacterium]
MKLNRIIVAILVLMTVGLQARLWIGEGSLAHVSGLRIEVDKQISENNQKKWRNEILKAEIVDLRDGLEAIEAKARNELGLIKEGETFFLLLED